MLILTRKCQEMVVIGGAKGISPMVTVTVLEIKGQTVRLGFAAEATIPVHRWEIWQQLQAGPPTVAAAIAH